MGKERGIGRGRSNEMERAVGYREDGKRGRSPLSMDQPGPRHPQDGQHQRKRSRVDTDLDQEHKHKRKQSTYVFLNSPINHGQHFE